MALADHKDLLTTLYGMNNAKASGDRAQWELLKAQYRNDLQAIQLKQSQKAQSDMESAYNKQMEAYQELSDKVSIYNRQMEFFQNPEKYPAWKSNPYMSANMLGVDHQVVQIARDRDIFNNLVKKYPWTEAAGAGAQLGVADNVQQLWANQQLYPHANQDIRRNIAAPGVNAQAALMTAQAQQYKGITERQNSVVGQLQFIKSIYPDEMVANNPQARRQRSLMYAKVLGIDPQYAFAIDTLSDQQLQWFALGVGGVSDPVQNVNAGVLPYAPKSPPTPQLTPEQKGQAEYTQARAAMLSAAQQANWTPQQIAEAEQRLAEKFGLMPKPEKASTAGISTVQQKAAQGLSQMFATIANPNMQEGESPEFGQLATLATVNNIIKLGALNGLDTQTQVQVLTSVLGDVAQQVATEDQTPWGQSMGTLLANGGQLYNLAVQAMANSGGKPVTLQGLGIDPMPVVRAAMANPNVIDATALAELIPNWQELAKQAQTSPLPVNQFPRTNPQQSKYVGRQERMNYGMGTSPWSQAVRADRHGYRVGQIVSVKTYESQVNGIMLTGRSRKSPGKYTARPITSQPDWRGRYKDEFELDPKNIIKTELMEGDIVRVGFTPRTSNRANLPSTNVVVVKVGKTGNETHQLPTGEVITIQAGDVLVETSKGEYVAIPITEIMGKIGRKQNAATNSPGIAQPTR